MDRHFPIVRAGLWADVSALRGWTSPRLTGTVLLEQNDEWAVQPARCMTLETIAPLRDDLALTLPAAAA
ncbi:hypothetical protein CHT98_12500 (plasmid) [Azospirillum brasilense]|uniref:Uncharacterized protein n=1 Tax=Azospirillum brasilense TaxID=192 RepID=A0A235HDY8_AZOBR|nr:hypothetical protein CHT98_12500 [Azospirillum brasilense]